MPDSGFNWIVGVRQQDGFRHLSKSCDDVRKSGAGDQDETDC